jgi:hypothetical protein
MPEDLITIDQLTRHLEGRAYDSNKVTSVVKLDVNVFGVAFNNDANVVARVIPGPEALVAISTLSSILGHLDRYVYPAEKKAMETVQTISRLDRPLPIGAVLATTFVPGTRPERNRVTFHKLGQLLGQLHALPVPTDTQKGGAWHHLTLEGGLDEECVAAAAMLDAAQQGDGKDADITRLRDALDHVRSTFSAEDANLPKALVHPDFVPSNVIVRVGSGEWVIVDWVGAGVGPRIVGLGFLLGVGAIRGKLVLVQAVMKGYAARLEPAELRVLREAAYARFLTMACWEVGVGRKTAAEAAKGLDALLDMGDAVVAKVKEIETA